MQKKENRKGIGAENENDQADNKSEKKGNSHDGVWIAIIAIVVVGILFEDGTRHMYDSLVSKDQNVTSNESVYRNNVHVVGQVVESMWRIFKAQLSHESETLVDATRLRSDYDNALKEGKSEDVVNIAMQFKVLSVNEAFPQLTTTPLAEQTQVEVKSSINELEASFRYWMKDVKDYNTARGSVFGRISVYVWAHILGGTDLPEKHSYYNFRETELNVTKILN